ncbi:MAG: hypothetical protein H9536_10340 [Aphanizomenon flos-aquae Clear-A1]|jgi:hypothetical protein|nr:hypothetical protein [Aphanizomenon flos-aquae Clear-A1]
MLTLSAAAGEIDLKYLDESSQILYPNDGTRSARSRKKWTNKSDSAG